MNVFSNCISLGWFCGVAASLGKWGVRDFSGPFDWYWSDYKSVIELIDNEFTDFFIRENLVMDTNRQNAFEDLKYGFKCFHDIRTNLEDDYPDIYERYQRRAKRFMEALRGPSCLFRAVRSVDEISYIVDNVDYIESVIKKYNSENSVVYLLSSSLAEMVSDTELPFIYYNVQSEYLCDAYGVRTLFDHNEDLKKFLQSLFPSERITRNKEHYAKLNSTCASEIYNAINNNDTSVIDKILAVLETTPQEGLYLWGFGYHGKALYRFLRDYNIQVLGIIDQNADSMQIGDVSFVNFADLQQGSKVFVSIADGAVCDEVMDKLEKKGCKCISYKDL